MNKLLKNDIITLKGQLHHAPSKTKPRRRELRKNTYITSTHLTNLADDLRGLIKNWNFTLLSSRVLVTAEYIEVIAKSNRITRLLKPVNCDHLSDIVCGARFETDITGKNTHHVIVYKTTKEAIQQAIKELDSASSLLTNHCAGFATNQSLKNLSKSLLVQYGFSLSALSDLLVDAYFVQRFYIGSAGNNCNDDMLVSLYRVGNQQALINLLAKIGIRASSSRFLNDDTVLLRQEERALLGEKADWLIAMEVRDLMSYDTSAQYISSITHTIQIPNPCNEPTVGVIDTRFDTRVYFAKWVEYHDCINKSIPLKTEDYRHGTAVSSLIVNGPLINPHLDDGCGFFRVRHFAVAPHGLVSSFDVLRNIRDIVRNNRDIKVWNLCLGSTRPCPKNFISPEGAELDRIQRDFDVIFVVAGTNAKNSSPNVLSQLRIGAPADAVNPVVVNSCDADGNPAIYSRRGPVLDFFWKPDVSCQGGVPKAPMLVCTNCGQESVIGTSFAAPWIARKLAYLIETLQLSRSEAKALLIDSCVGWLPPDDKWPWRGWGCVPQKIEAIIHSATDEIRFIISGKIKDYETFSYDIPIPLASNGQLDYDVRATLCYFPECRREQGVDYTLTELDLHFGRVDNRKGNADIVSIDHNQQGKKGNLNLPENLVRTYFRKWDNVKVRSQTFKRYLAPFNAQGLWGLKILSKERLPEKFGQEMPFSLVVTLRSRLGENRYSNFMKSCQAKGWLVNTINVNNLVSISSKLSQSIDLED